MILRAGKCNDVVILQLRVRDGDIQVHGGEGLHGETERQRELLRMSHVSAHDDCDHRTIPFLA